MAPTMRSAFIALVDFTRTDCKEVVKQEAVDKLKTLDHDVAALSRMKDGWSHCTSKRLTMELNIVDELLNAPPKGSKRSSA